MTITFSSTITANVSTTSSTFSSTTSLTFSSTSSLTTIITTTISTTISTTSSTIVSTIRTIPDCDIFYQESFYSNGKEPYAIAIGDLNKDKISDVVISYANEDKLEITLHSSYGTILSRRKHNNNARALSIVLGDIDSDGKRDIITVNLHGNKYSIGMSLYIENNSFSVPILHQCQWNTLRAVALIDFNKDENLDVIAVSGDASGVIYFLRNTGGDRLTCYNNNYYVSNTPLAIAIGKINGDAFDDFVLSTDGHPTFLTFFYYHGNGAFYQTTGKQVSFASSITLGDLNNDGYLDIITTSLYHRESGILFSEDSLSYSSHVLYAIDGYSKSLVIADLNDDENYDIIIGSVETNIITVFLNFGNSTLRPRKTYNVSRTPRVIGLIDANNDQKPDIIYADERSEYVGVLLRC
ncbi:unnamed protein product [Adineta ricciae]|uniref:Uncharacterized protein n=1 Tax=Adineta ricciae TaxID=249248 RepID=A0A815ZE39_ADIRI|nr:unnamed protein product [Adineta ricciae]CAF1583360.1 unnamed protein product [Adineta ricciae]